ncbi:MAG: NAD(P)H-dependent oxidoreductase [Candidatus Hadarchaeales archaeon]
MPKVLIVYHSETGNTKKMAELIAAGTRDEKVEVTLKEVRAASVEDLLAHDGVIIGSPTYYGAMSSEIKKFLDESVKYHGKLDGKVGGAFTSSGNVGGGNETTIMGIIQALLIHGMIVQGTPHGDHYGPVAVGRPDERCQRLCREYGRRIARLIKKAAG